MMSEYSSTGRYKPWLLFCCLSKPLIPGDGVMKSDRFCMWCFARCNVIHNKMSLVSGNLLPRLVLLPRLLFYFIRVSILSIFGIYMFTGRKRSCGKVMF